MKLALKISAWLMLAALALACFGTLVIVGLIGLWGSK